MRAALGALGALAIAACDVVFPATPVRDAPDVVAPDGPSGPTVTGTLAHRTAITTAGGAPMPTSGGFGPVTASVRFADDTEVVVPVDANGNFGFERPTATTPYRLSVARSGSETLEIQDAAATITFAEAVAGRENATPVGPSTTILLPVPAAQPVVTSTGQFTQTPLVPPAAGQNASMAWANAVTIGRVPLGLLDKDANDLLYYFDIASAPDLLAGAPHNRILRMFSAKVKMTGTANETIDLRATPVQTPGANLCRRITAPRVEVRRFLGVQPEFTTVGTDWLVSAQPDRAHSQLGALLVFSAGFGADGQPAIDVEPSGPNPWVGQYQLLASTGAAHSRPYRHPQAVNAVQFGPQLRVYAIVDDGTDCATQTLVASDIAFASAIAIDGTVLAADDTTLARPAADPTIAWQPTAGTTDRWEVTLIEAIKSGNDTSFRTIRSIQTTATQAALDRRDLVSGRRYLVRVTAFRGHPGAARGDYATISYPYAFAQAFTRVFAVQ